MKTCWFHLMPYRFLPENPPAYAQEFARLIRAAAVRRIPSGHMLHLESPDAVADAAVKFLSS